MSSCLLTQPSATLERKSLKIISITSIRFPASRNLCLFQTKYTLLEKKWLLPGRHVPISTASKVKINKFTGWGGCVGGAGQPPGYHLVSSPGYALVATPDYELVVALLRRIASYSLPGQQQTILGLPDASLDSVRRRPTSKWGVHTLMKLLRHTQQYNGTARGSAHSAIR